MGANRRAGGGVSPAVSPGIGHGALKAGAHHRGTESTENGIGKTANAWFNSVLTQRREGAKNCERLGGRGGRGWGVAGGGPGDNNGLEGRLATESTEGMGASCTRDPRRG